MPTGTLADFASRNMQSILFTLVILNVIQTTIGLIMWGMIRNIKEGITWGDTCEKLHIEVNRRLKRLEDAENGRT